MDEIDGLTPAVDCATTGAMSKISCALLLLVLSVPATSGATEPAAASPFPFEAARAAVFFTGLETTFPDGATGFTTCAAVVLDTQSRRLAVPLQCVGQAKEIACRSAVEVPLARQLNPGDFRRWIAEKSTCKVVERSPELDLALLQVQRPLAAGVTAPQPRSAELAIGETVWTIGFPEQIPSMLTRGTVAAMVEKVRIDGLPPQFAAPLIAVSGAISEGSAGAALFDSSGRWAGIVIADARYFDGGFAIPRAAIAKLGR